MAKKLPPHVPSGDPVGIFNASEVFRDAAYILYQRTGVPTIEDHTRAILMCGVMVNQSLSVEHALKCISAMEKSKFLPIHDLKYLFDDLSEDIKAEITDYFDMFRATNRGIKKLKEIIPQEVDLKDDIITCLEEARNAFVDFRYPYENKPYELRYRLGDMQRATREYILNNRPNWRVLIASETNVVYPHAQFIKR